MERGATVFDIASAVCYLVSAAAVTGEVLLVDGGQHLVGSMRDVMFETPRASLMKFNLLMTIRMESEYGCYDYFSDGPYRESIT